MPREPVRLARFLAQERDDGAVESLEQQVLELVESGRTTSIVAWLYSERHQGDPLAAHAVEGALAGLVARGWVVQDDRSGTWRRTADGELALWVAHAWRCEVAEIVRIDVPPHAVVSGQVLSGVVRRGDWFAVEDPGNHDLSYGQVVGATYDHSPGHVRLALLVLHGELRQGDVLWKTQPPPDETEPSPSADQRAARSTVRPTTLPATYEDRTGVHDLVLQIEPSIGPSRYQPSYNIRASLGGVVFDGFDFDTLRAVDPPAAALAGFDEPRLVGGVLSGELPCEFEVDGDRIAASITFRLDLDELNAPRLTSRYLTLGATVRGASAEVEDEWFEDGISRLEAALPDHVQIRCCRTCLYSDYSTDGHGLSGMLCHRDDKERHLAVRSLGVDWPVPVTEEVLETHVCDEYARRPPVQRDEAGT